MDIFIRVVLFYILFMCVIFIAQRTLIYFPDKSKPALIHGVEVVKLTTQDGQHLEAWYIPPTTENQLVIVLFHGNAGHYGHRINKVKDYLVAGYGVLLAEYRGYGGNSGAISEVGFYHDGRAYMNWLLKKKNVNIEKIIPYGESIGSGVAVQMATEYDVGGLVLEVPFSSLLDIASRQYPFMPVKYLLKDRYMNIEKIDKINAPLLILHGHKDQTIPFDSAEKLFEMAKYPKKLIDFPQGNHNNLYDFGASQYVLDFLAGIDERN
ncbi:MAG: hypothetical protein COA45_10215 [Zetaproteobacteria bacterium]|nr:MAG: hypothetical protein COA45_10215 [Zetaproteobacteria bacterium]